MAEFLFDPVLASLLEKYDQKGFSIFMRILELEKKDGERELYEGSLLEFVKRAWREIESSELSISWHHERIIEALEAITNEEIRDLIINIPPRCSKSLLVNVFYPAWIWCRSERSFLSGPQVKFLCVSYGATLSETIALKMQRLVAGEWYQSLWGDRVKMRQDMMSRANFGNEAGGERISTSIEAGLLGRGADLQVVDDPHNLEGAESDLQREATLRAISEGLPTRVTDPRRVARILIMQRLHTEDCTAWCLTHWRKDLMHLMYPMKFDSARACIGDPRVIDGELLWPEMWTDEVVTQMQVELSEYSKAGQFQQMPVPRGGGIIKSEWWKDWPELDPVSGQFPHGAVIGKRIQYPAFEYIVGSVDTALTDKENRDPSAMTVWGLFRDMGKGRIERRADGTYERVADDVGFPKVLLMFGWQKRVYMHGPPEEIPYGVTKEEWNSPEFRRQRQESWGLVQWVLDTAKRYKIDYLIIEAQAAGLQLEQEIRTLHEGHDFGLEVKAAREKKFERLRAVEHLWSNGQVYRPAYEDGTMPTWCEQIFDQICQYPRTKHDDFVDCSSAALAHMRAIGLFQRREEWRGDEDALMEYDRNRQVTLPYQL